MLATAWRYDAKPLWRDEFYTLLTARRSYPVMLRGLEATDAGMGPWYALVHPWVQVSQTEAWLRLPGAVATVVTAALVALIARRLAGPLAGAAAGACFALAPVVVEHSQEARPYPVIMTCAAATAYGLLREREHPRARWLALWVGAATLSAALHVLTGAPAVAALIAVALALPGRAGRLRVLLGGLLPALVTAGMVAVGFSQAPDRISGDFPLAARTIALWHTAAGSPLALAVLAVLCAAGLLRLRREVAPLLLVVAWALAPVAANVASALGGQLFEPRYTTATAPALAVLAGVGVAALAGRGSAGQGLAGQGLAGRGLAGRTRAARVRAVVAVLACALVVAGQVPHLALVRQRPYSTDDMPSGARALAARAQSGDAVVYLGNTTRPMAGYYLARSLPRDVVLDDVLLARDPARSVSIGGDEVPDARRAAALAGRARVWVVGVRLRDPWDVVFPASVAAARSGRSLAFGADHGQMRVELWTASGDSPTTP